MQAMQRKAFSCDSSIRSSARPARAARAVRCTAQLRKADVGAVLASGAALLAPAAQAAENISNVATADGSMVFAAGGGAAVVGLAALLVATDPQKRCAEGVRSRLSETRARGANGGYCR